MNKCQKCNVTIIDDSDRCPLCRHVLQQSETPGINCYPNAIQVTKRFRFLENLVLFLSLLTGCVLGGINYMVNPDVPWSLVVALILAIVLSIFGGISNKNPLDLAVQGALTPFRAAATALTTMAEKYYGYMFRYEALAAENEVLKKQIAEMEDTARQAESVSRENQRLRKGMNLLETHEDYKLVDAYIIGWSTSDWESTFTINRGTNAGIQENMCAITANGEVVGLVTEAGVNYAVVKTVLDSTLEISGTIATSGYNGMVRGGYTSGNDTLLQMNYLPSDAIIRNKDQVVTSGSTVYPRGLIMGYVVDAGFEETGVAKYALLDPAADINSLEQLFIITDYTTEVTSKTPEETQATEATEETQPYTAPLG